MATCDPSTTISAEDLEGYKKDIVTTDEVVDSPQLTTTTKSGTVIDTLNGRLLKLGFQPPIPYAGGIPFTSNDLTKTIDRSGVIYAPAPSQIPFTTSGTWAGDDENKFYVVQQKIIYQLDSIATLRAQPAGFTDWLQVQGYSGIGTSGGDDFYWDAASTDPDDNGFIILPTGHTGPGRNKRNSEIITPEKFGAVGNGTNDDNAAVQDAIDYANSIGGGIVDFQAKQYRAPNLIWRENVFLRGVTALTDNTSTGSWILGEPGSDVLTFAYNPTDSANNFRLDGLSISGGENQIVSTDVVVWCFIDNMRLSAPVNANIKTRGFVQQWFWNNVDLNGGRYGWLFENLPGLNGGANVLMDKCAFRNLRSSGHTEEGMRFEIANSNGVLWDSCTSNNNTKHGWYVDGGIREWTFINNSTERNHFGGGKVATTGTISSGTNALTVASGAGISNGDAITVRGAGPNGNDLASTVNSGGGTTNLVLADNASNSVTALDVTNALYDNWYFNNTIGTPASITFIGVFASSGVGGDIVRYAINCERASKVTIVNSTMSAGREIYDPSQVVSWNGGQGGIRHPLLETSSNYKETLFPPIGKAANVGSPQGGNIVLGLVDSNGNASGSFGEVQIRQFNPNRDRLWYVNGESAALPMGMRGTQFLMGNFSDRGVFIGSGTPEGVVTAGVGTIFLRTDGGAGTSFYVKESGTGNTGWVAK